MQEASESGRRLSKTTSPYQERTTEPGVETNAWTNASDEPASKENAISGEEVYEYLTEFKLILVILAEAFLPSVDQGTFAPATPVPTDLSTVYSSHHQRSSTPFLTSAGTPVPIRWSCELSPHPSWKEIRSDGFLAAAVHSNHWGLTHLQMPGDGTECCDILHLENG